MTGTSSARVLRWNGAAQPSEIYDELAVEEPLEIRAGGRPVGVTMRTPGHDFELAAGFLLTEGLLRNGSPPLLRQERPNRVNAALNGIRAEAIQRAARGGFIGSSCGLCGKAAVEAVHQRFPPIDDDFVTSREVIAGLLVLLDQRQPVFARTGGLHAAALFDSAGNLVAAREDIGRHNAVDKVLGQALLRRLLPLRGHILLVSGRASFEILQKALGAAIAIVAAVSAPSSLAVQFAEESGQTLVGFLRPGRFNVYSHPERVRL